MKIILCAIALSCIHHAWAEEAPVCKKCEIIREENKQKPQPPEYYEDYLQQNKTKVVEQPSDHSEASKNQQ